MSCLDTFIRGQQSQDLVKFLDSGGNRLRASTNSRTSPSLHFQIYTVRTMVISYGCAEEDMKLYFETTWTSRSFRSVIYDYGAVLLGVGGLPFISLHTKYVSNGTWLKPGTGSPPLPSPLFHRLLPRVSPGSCTSMPQHFTERAILQGTTLLTFLKERFSPGLTTIDN